MTFSTIGLHVTLPGPARREPEDHPETVEFFLHAPRFHWSFGSAEAGRHRPAPPLRRYKAYAESHPPIRHGYKVLAPAAALPIVGPDAGGLSREFSGREDAPLLRRRVARASCRLRT